MDFYCLSETEEKVLVPSPMEVPLGNPNVLSSVHYSVCCLLLLKITES